MIHGALCVLGGLGASYFFSIFSAFALVGCAGGVAIGGGGSYDAAMGDASNSHGADVRTPVKVMDRGIMTAVGALVILGGVSSAFMGVAGLLMKYLFSFLSTQLGGATSGMLTFGHQEELLMWVNLVLYVPSGVGLVILGLGTIRCRKWARTLMESLSALLTLVGVVGTVISLVMLIFLREIFSGFFDSYSSGVVDDKFMGVMIIVFAVIILGSGIFFIGVPAALWWFYRLPSVHALCQIWDPVGSWVDRNPPLVNAMVMVNVAIIFLTLPFYVIDLSGSFEGRVLIISMLLVICAALTIASIGLAKMQLWGWVLEFTLALVLSIIGSWWVVTYSTRGVAEWYLGIIGFAQTLSFPESTYRTIDLLAHFIIWGSSLPIMYVLLRELRGFLRGATPPKLQAQ